MSAVFMDRSTSYCFITTKFMYYIYAWINTTYSTLEPTTHTPYY